MPNWCSNTLTIKGNAEDIKKFKEQAVGYRPYDEPDADEEPNLLEFHKLYPIPDGILKSDYHTIGYQWEIEHWGDKWGSSSTYIGEETDRLLVYKFETPWLPPLLFLKHVAAEWPKLKFDITFDEEGELLKGRVKFKGNGYVVYAKNIETLACVSQLTHPRFQL